MWSSTRWHRIYSGSGNVPYIQFQSVGDFIPEPRCSKFAVGYKRCRCAVCCAKYYREAGPLGTRIYEPFYIRSIGHEETLFHRFFECPFSISCWNTIPISWNMNLQPLDMVIEAREAPSSGKSSSPLVGQSGWSKMVWFLTMSKLISIHGGWGSQKNLALYAQKPNQRDKLYSICGETALHNVFVSILFPFGPWCLVILLYLYCSFFYLIEKQKNR